MLLAGARHRRRLSSGALALGRWRQERRNRNGLESIKSLSENATMSLAKYMVRSNPMEALSSSMFSGVRESKKLPKNTGHQGLGENDGIRCGQEPEAWRAGKSPGPSLASARASFHNSSRPENS